MSQDYAKGPQGFFLVFAADVNGDVPAVRLLRQDAAQQHPLFQQFHQLPGLAALGHLRLVQQPAQAVHVMFRHGVGVRLPKQGQGILPDPFLQGGEHALGRFDIGSVQSAEAIVKPVSHLVQRLLAGRLLQGEQAAQQAGLLQHDYQQGGKLLEVNQLDVLEPRRTGLGHGYDCHIGGDSG